MRVRDFEFLYDTIWRSLARRFRLVFGFRASLWVVFMNALLRVDVMRRFFVGYGGVEVERDE